MANIRKYKKLRKEGYTILGLYKIGKQDGMTPEEIVVMLEKALPSDKDSWQHSSHEEIVKFMRRMEFGEENCMICQKSFVDKPGEWCNHNCPECQKNIDEMWKKIYDELGNEELSSEEMGGMFGLVTLGAIAKSVAKDSLAVPSKTRPGA